MSYHCPELTMPETRRYCPHCEEHVSSTTFRRHKQLYYDQRCKKWHHKSQSSSESEMEYSQEDVSAGHCVAGLEGVVGKQPSTVIYDVPRITYINQLLLTLDVLCIPAFFSLITACLVFSNSYISLF